MSLVLPIVSKSILGSNEIKQVYSCPPDKTHAMVSVTFTLDRVLPKDKDIHVNIYITKDGNVLRNSPDNIFIKSLPIGHVATSPKLNTIVIGPNERLYVELIGEGPLVVRVNGEEQKDPEVDKAGVLGHTRTKANVLSEVVEVGTLGDPTLRGTMMLSNNNPKEATVYIWVSDSKILSLNSAAQLIDRVALVKIKSNESVLLQNIKLRGKERVTIHSNVADVTSLLNGIISKDV